MRVASRREAGTIRTKEKALKGESHGRTRTKHSGEARRGDQGVKRVAKPRRRRSRGHGRPKASRTDRNRRRDRNPMRGGRGRRPAETTRGQSLERMQLRRGTRSDRPFDRARYDGEDLMVRGRNDTRIVPTTGGAATGRRRNRPTPKDEEGRRSRRERTRRTEGPKREQNLTRVARPEP
jgi:hypothetical protein